MSTLYGDNIFESNLDILYNSIIESSKLFEDFDIVTEAEGNIKDRIIKAIKDVIQKVKDFFKWIKEKVLKFVHSVVDKVKKANLKKKLNDAKAKLKRSNNESTVLTEATYSELEDWLKTEVKTYKQQISAGDYNNFDDLIGRKSNLYEYDIHKEESGYVYVRTYEGSDVEKYTYIEIKDISIENFINGYGSDIDSLKKMIELINNNESKLEAVVRRLEKDLRNITTKSNQQLIDEINSKELRYTINCMNKGVTLGAKMINASTSCIKDIEHTVISINNKLTHFNNSEE